MKKIITGALMLVMLLAMAVSASAETKCFNYTVPCAEISDSLLYQYNAGVYITEGNGDSTIDVAHEVPGANTIETNRIAIYRKTEGKTIGASWKPANGNYYAYQSSVIKNGNQYSIAARGNTKYQPQFGDTITLYACIRD